MITLFVSLALLGLAAVDPIGLAIMPILLMQRRPLARCGAFLSGSFVSLMLMGLLFARGFGTMVLQFEHRHAWLVPDAEIVAGLILIGIAAAVFWQLKTGRLSAEPSPSLKRRLQLNNWHLFAIGAGLVAVQSLLDVVFVIAMIRIGQLQVSVITLWAAVATYAAMALVLQGAIVGAYLAAPVQHRRQTLGKIQQLLTRYANEAVIGISLLLGCGLFFIGVRAR